MRPFRFIPSIVCALLAWTSPAVAQRHALPVWGANAAGGMGSAGANHDVYIYAGVGASNGARLGVMHSFLPHFSGEVSFGYVRLLNYFSVSGRPSISTGITPSIGVTYMTSSDRSSYGIASLLFSYQVGTEKIVFQHERRLAVTAAIGSEFAITGRLSGQVRLGPSAHIILAPARGPVQLLMHYDGSIGWRL